MCHYMYREKMLFQLVFRTRTLWHASTWVLFTTITMHALSNSTKIVHISHEILCIFTTFNVAKCCTLCTISQIHGLTCLLLLIPTHISCLIEIFHSLFPWKLVREIEHWIYKIPLFTQLSMFWLKQVIFEDKLWWNSLWFYFMDLFKVKWSFAFAL